MQRLSAVVLYEALGAGALSPLRGNLAKLEVLFTVEECRRQPSWNSFRGRLSLVILVVLLDITRSFYNCLKDYSFSKSSRCQHFSFGSAIGAICRGALILLRFLNERIRCITCHR